MNFGTTNQSIDWKLIAGLPVGSNKDAVENLNWYAMRWKIEVFHKILEWCLRKPRGNRDTAPLPRQKSPGSAAISPAIHRPAIWPCGKAGHDSWISNWAQPWGPDLWAIEGIAGRLQARKIDQVRKQCRMVPR